MPMVKNQGIRLQGTSYQSGIRTPAAPDVDRHAKTPTVHCHSHVIRNVSAIQMSLFVRPTTVGEQWTLDRHACVYAICVNILYM